MDKKLPKVSVIIASRNRAGCLRECVRSIVSIPAAAGELEIVIVDNGSSDETAMVVQDLAQKSRVPICGLYEPIPGLSHARNRGLKHATGEITAFVDDDIEVAAGWLQAVIDAFQDPMVWAVGGPVSAPPALSLPAWLPRKYWYMLGLFNGGTQFRTYAKRECMPGGNMALRKWVFSKTGLFDTELGRKQDQLLAGEEVALYRKILSLGGQVAYHPDMLVYHKIAERINLQYLLKYAYHLGVSDALLEKKGGYWLKRQLKTLRSYALSSLQGIERPPRNRFAATTEKGFEASYKYYYARGYLGLPQK